MRAAHILLLSPLLSPAPLLAEEFAPAPPPPEMSSDTTAIPPEVAEQAMPEPEVTIIKRSEETIEEYRVNGQLYMVKITPSKGYPYYLIDSDGDGSLETRRNELDNPPLIQWKILQW